MKEYKIQVKLLFKKENQKKKFNLLCLELKANKKGK